MHCWWHIKSVHLTKATDEYVKWSSPINSDPKYSPKMQGSVHKKRVSTEALTRIAKNWKAWKCPPPGEEGKKTVTSVRTEAAGEDATPGTASTGKPISPRQGLIPALQQGAWARNAWLKHRANPKELLEDILDLYLLTSGLPSEKVDIATLSRFPSRRAALVLTCLIPKANSSRLWKALGKP